MNKSARLLGQDYGLNSQEMNRLLKDQGFLDGVPGEYFVTEKGAPFANEKYYHRGTGGYTQYNREWMERTWDESIIKALDTSPESCQAARDAVAEARRAKWDAIKADRIKADTTFRASQSAFFTSEKVDLTSTSSSDTDDGLCGLVIAGIIAGGTALCAGIVFGIHKAAPYVKKWWHENVVPLFNGEDN